MKRKALFIFLPLLISTLSGCERYDLATPIIEVGDDNLTLVWAPVEGATSYQVKENKNKPIEASFYDFRTVVGEYKVSVRALGEDGKKSKFSEPFVYETKYTGIEDLSLNNGVITPVGLQGAGFEIKKDDGEYIAVAGNSYTVTEYGFYTVRPLGGFNREENVYYIIPSTNASKSIVASPLATEEYILEDGEEADDATLQGSYVAEKWDSRWQASTATLNLSDENFGGISEGNCVQINYWKHSAWFRFEKRVSFDSAYDTLAFKLKGDGASTFGIFFEINDTKIVGGLNFTGVYMSYKVTSAVMNNRWTQYEVSLDDPNAWTIAFAGADRTFSYVQEYLANLGCKLQSVKDAMALFDTYSLRVNCTNDGNYSSTRVYVDDVKLLNTGRQTSSEVMSQNSRVYEEYALSSTNPNTAKGYIKLNESRTAAKGSLFVGNDTLKFEENELAVAVSGDELTLTSTKTGSDFVLKVSSNDVGLNWNYVSATGTLKDAFVGVKLGYMKMFDDFNSYDSTGVGLDQHNAFQSELCGLRGAYYADYWANSGESPVGGSGWSLMGSTDYLELETTQGRGDSKSAKVKASGNTMRYINLDLAKPVMDWDTYAPVLAKGFSKLSFVAKGGTKKDVKIKFYAYYQNTINPSTQQQSRSSNETIVVPQNSDWNEYSVSLDTNRTYYGFSIVIVGEGSTDYFFLDNIYFHNDVSAF